MGMFDNVKCLYKLPLTKELENLNINWQDLTWQTKSLESCLEDYTITKQGKLTRHIVDGEWVELPKNQQYKWNTHEFNKTGERKETVKYHGVLNFYTYEFIEKDGWWVEFDAYFTQGKLDKIELRQSKKDENRALEQEKIWEEIKQQRLKPWYRFRQAVGPYGWTATWRFVTNTLIFISNKLQNLRMFIIRHVS